jgi:magnesium-transporting ATPase (P-type)
MVGESIADADALKAADVGISMRSGCDVTKDKSDLVLLKNDFEQIRIAVMWGRLLYKNVERFLTFQLTVNISITVVTIIGGIIGHPPLNVIQMLWVNLIMDILAAISLSTEAWSDNGNTVLAQRAQRTEELLKPTMWRTILVQAVYQVTVMIVLMFFGGLMMGFDQAPNIIYDKLRDPKTKLGTDRLIMDTFIFHVFVLMNLFNSINVRASNPDDLNIFSGITNALWFVLVLALEFFIQQTMINYGSQELTIAAVLFGTGQLSTTMNIVAYVLGFLSIPIGIASKKIDESKFEFTKKWTLT